MTPSVKVHMYSFIFALIFLISNHVPVKADGEKKFKYEPLTSKEALEIQKDCKGSMPAAEVRVTPPGVALPKNFENYLQRILNLEVREDDIWIISYPKSGNTWTQEMVWLLTNNVDIAKANSEYLWIRVPFLEYKGLCSADNTEPDPIEQIEKEPRDKRRYIKTHLPVELLPKEIWTKKPKIIHVSRNPYDVAVSYFYHFQIWNNYVGSKDTFFKAFLQDEVVMSPFWKHVRAYWEVRTKYGNILYIKYEDMKQDLVSVMKKVAEFLDIPYPKDKENDLLNHLSFESMRNNKWDNFEEDIRVLHPGDYENYHYMRKGKVGSWKEEKEFTPELINQFREWTNKNLEGSDFQKNHPELKSN